MRYIFLQSKVSNKNYNINIFGIKYSMLDLFYHVSLEAALFVK